MKSKRFLRNDMVCRVLRHILAKKCRKLIFVFILLGAGCETDTHAPTLSLDTFADVYAEALILSTGVDSLQARAKVDSLLEKKNISLEDMEQTVAAYERDQEQWRLFWALVVKKMEDKASAVVKADSLGK